MLQDWNKTWSRLDFC